MKTKQMVSAVSLATVMALASPAHAALLGGGAGGRFAGSLGGMREGFGGGLAGQSTMNGSLHATDSHAAKKTAQKADSKPNATKSTASNGTAQGSARSRGAASPTGPSSISAGGTASASLGSPQG